MQYGNLWQHSSKRQSQGKSGIQGTRLHLLSLGIEDPSSFEYYALDADELGEGTGALRPGTADDFEGMRGPEVSLEMEPDELEAFAARH